MKPIIGLDFGDTRIIPCFIQGFDVPTRTGYAIRDLLPPRVQEGIPCVYYYSDRVGEPLLCEDAVRPRARPLQNRLKYLRRHLGETARLDGRDISYDQAITDVVQHCIRIANGQLYNGWKINTNLISLSYPVTYTLTQLQRLVELVEKATLEDGTKIKVCGTIAEPAAIALDYLYEFDKTNKGETVLVCDLEEGAFDVTLISAYPNGKKDIYGHLCYYEIIATDRIEDFGGCEFDQVIYNILFEKMPKKFETNTNVEMSLKNMAESIRVELYDLKEETASVYVEQEYVDLPVNIKEFEKKSRTLVMQIMSRISTMIDRANDNEIHIDHVILTGSAIRIPFIMSKIQEKFNEYKERVVVHRPNRSVAYGTVCHQTIAIKVLGGHSDAADYWVRFWEF